MKKNSHIVNFCVEEFLQTIENLQDETDAIILVEGIRDKEALLYWDITLPIECFKPPPYEFGEYIREKYQKRTKIILLFDADPEGRKYHNFFKNDFRTYGYRTSSSYWLKFQRYKITCIEGLKSSFFEQIRAEQSFNSYSS